MIPLYLYPIVLSYPIHTYISSSCQLFKALALATTAGNIFANAPLVNLNTGWLWKLPDKDLYGPMRIAVGGASDAGIVPERVDGNLEPVSYHAACERRPKPPLSLIGTQWKSCPSGVSAESRFRDSVQAPKML